MLTQVVYEICIYTPFKHIYVICIFFPSQTYNMSGLGIHNNIVLILPNYNEFNLLFDNVTRNIPARLTYKNYNKPINVCIYSDTFNIGQLSS